MKRWIALLLVLAAFCAMALGSGHKRPIDTSEPDVNALKPKPKPSNISELEQSTEEEAPAGPTFEETVLYDRQGVKLTATGITYGVDGPAVGLLLENGTARTLRAACEGLDVNGYRISAPADFVGAPECRTYAKLAVDPGYLVVCGISEIAQLDLDVELSDAKTGSALPGTESVRIRTDAAREDVYTADKTGRVLYYEGGVEITVKGRDGRARRNADLVLCISNTNDDPVEVRLSDLSINNLPFDAALRCTVPKGRVALGIVRVAKDDLEARNVTPERYTLRFEIYDTDSGDLLDATDALRVAYADLRPLP